MSLTSCQFVKLDQRVVLLGELRRKRRVLCFEIVDLLPQGRDDHTLCLFELRLGEKTVVAVQNIVGQAVVVFELQMVLVVFKALDGEVVVLFLEGSTFP